MTKKTFGRYSAILAAAFAAITQTQAATSFYYPDFGSLSGLQLNGHAPSATAAAPGDVLRLTDNYNESGSVFSTSAITLTGASFSTYFSFQMTGSRGIFDDDGNGADGIVFVVQTVSNTAGGAGGGIGYAGLQDSVGIEFDTYGNGHDPDGNHVGVNLDGAIVSSDTVYEPTRFNDGQVWHSWVDYNGATDLLEVRYSLGASRPALANLSYVVDLELILGSPNAYVGFTAGTGSAANEHDILEWQFNAEYAPIDQPVPEPGTVVGAFGLAALIGARTLRRSRKS